jgi:hypothetical protein
MNSVVQKPSILPSWLGAAAAWMFSILIGLTGVAVLVGHQLAAGVLLLLSALVVFPPASAVLQRQANFRIPVWPKIAGAIALLLAGAALLPKPPEAQATSPSDAAFVPAAQGVAAAKLLLLDDFRGYLEGHKVVGDWSTVLPLGQRISASQLFAAYHENEVAADEQFKGKALVVTGYLESINKDIFNNGYLVLHDANEFEGVHATLTDDTLKSAGNLSRGQRVTLLCTGEGMIIGSPVLKECDTVDVIVSQKRAAIEDMVDQFFAGGHDQPDPIRRMMGYGYAIGTAMPQPNPCQTAVPGEMQRCTAEMHAVPVAEVRRRYSELSKRFALPALPEPSRKY